MKKMRLYVEEKIHDETKPDVKDNRHLIQVENISGENKVSVNSDMASYCKGVILDEYYTDYRIEKLENLNNVRDEAVYKYRDILLKKFGYSDFEKEKEYFNMNLATIPVVERELYFDPQKKGDYIHDKVRKIIKISNKKNTDLLTRVDNILLK